MKRSKSIKLVLIGALSLGVGTGCDQVVGPAPVSSSCVYTNNHYVPGVGYYHAPFRAFYELPYNHYDPARKSFYYGGQWELTPHLCITNISSPTEVVAQQAEGQRTDVSRGGYSRGGFGGSSHYHSIWS